MFVTDSARSTVMEPMKLYDNSFSYLNFIHNKITPSAHRRA